MTLTGMKKHVQHPRGRRAGDAPRRSDACGNCRLGPRRLDDESAWIETYRQMLDDRLDRLGEFLERTKEKSP